MITLHAGDVRQKGDEYRHVDNNDRGFDCRGQLYGHYKWRPLTMLRKPREAMPGPWRPVRLVGHPILQSDLMVHEFRRP
jgi:hypothetical protein